MKPRTATASPSDDHQRRRSPLRVAHSRGPWLWLNTPDVRLYTHCWRTRTRQRGAAHTRYQWRRRERPGLRLAGVSLQPGAIVRAITHARLMERSIPWSLWHILSRHCTQ